MNLQTTYKQQIMKELQDELGIKNPMAAPKLSKIIIHVGVGEALTDSKVLTKVSDQLAAITGQKPLVTRAKRSIASFKLRAGDEIGLKVTVRGRRMYDFLEKLLRVVLPRIRDFRGVPRSGFDDRGNYNLGVREQSVFPEVDYSKIDKLRGLAISLVTTAGNDESGYLLLKKLGMPFEKEDMNAFRK